MEDIQIIDLYFFRSEEAIVQTNEKYGKYCTYIAYNILKDKEDSTECVNDTYLKAWNSIPPHKPNVLKAFLGKITRNLALNQYNKKHTQKRGSEINLVLDELEFCMQNVNYIENEVYYKELVQNINNFLELLGKEKRIIFMERYWYLNSIKYISNKYKLSNSKVKMTLLRAREQLKNYLEERGEHI